MPERPLVTASHADSRELPTGETMPMPVTTTRRLLMAGAPLALYCVRGPEKHRAAQARPRLSARWGSGLDVGLDVVDRLLHGGDLLGFLVRDLALELFLEGHHQLDGVEGVGAQVVDERGAVGGFLFLDAQLLDDDLLDALFDGAHVMDLLPNILWCRAGIVSLGRPGGRPQRGAF